VTRISPPEESELDPAAREALAAARRELGGVPSVLRAVAAAPRALAGVWALVEGVLVEGRVPRTTKCLVALAAVASSGAESLRVLFRSSLEAQGVDPAILDDLERRGESGRLPERTQRSLAFARRAALQPALLVDDDFQALRREGHRDAELAELVVLGGALACLVAVARATRA
jgi:alkylhydroperoxidase family enzyme